MMAFFKVNLQQLLQAFETDQFNRIRGQTQTRNQVRRIMEESFVRTALHIINSDQPFTQVARTQTWMVTTANLVLLLYGDQTAQEQPAPTPSFHDRRVDPLDSGADQPPGLVSRSRGHRRMRDRATRCPELSVG